MNLFRIKRISRYHGVGLILVFMLVSSMMREAAALEVYKWIDRYGTTHYSTEAPQGHEKSPATIIKLAQQPRREADKSNQSQNYLPLLELAKELEQSRLIRERLRLEKIRLERESLSAGKAPWLDYSKIPQQNRFYSSRPLPYHGYFRFPFPRRYSRHVKSHHGKRPGFKLHRRSLHAPKLNTNYMGYRGPGSSYK